MYNIKEYIIYIRDISFKYLFVYLDKECYITSIVRFVSHEEAYMISAPFCYDVLSWKNPRPTRAMGDCQVFWRIFGKAKQRTNRVRPALWRKRIESSHSTKVYFVSDSRAAFGSSLQSQKWDSDHSGLSIIFLWNFFCSVLRLSAKFVVLIKKVRQKVLCFSSTVFGWKLRFELCWSENGSRTEKAFERTSSYGTSRDITGKVATDQR